MTANPSVRAAPSPNGTRRSCRAILALLSACLVVPVLALGAPATPNASTHAAANAVVDALATTDAVTPAARSTEVPRPPAGQVADPVMADRVKAEFLHAWKGYRQYAWGHDDLQPLSRTGKDWYGESLLMTPVDSLDTLLLMGFTDEAKAAQDLITTKLSFDRDVDVKHFEIVIRLLGGLLSSYQITGDRRLLALADDLGTRLLPAFDSPTGLPYVYVNLRTGKAHGTDSNPAESGTLLLEYGTLSKLTGKPVFYDTAKRALVKTYAMRSKRGLIGERFDVDTGKWTVTRSHIGARMDSYYEYLWKCWLLFGDRDCLAMWRTSIGAAMRDLPETVGGRYWVGHVDMDDGHRVASRYGALDAFFPGLLALSGDLPAAEKLQASSFYMWNLHGIEPEVYDYRAAKILSPGYVLRPEIVESTWVLSRLTADPQYRAMGAKLFADFVAHCRTDAGYASLTSVVTKEKADEMESFVLAETFKYFYLLYAAPDTLDPTQVVLNTEAHPLRRTWPVEAPAP